jgi:hypothetical protein
MPLHGFSVEADAIGQLGQVASYVSGGMGVDNSVTVQAKPLPTAPNVGISRFFDAIGGVSSTATDGPLQDLSLQIIQATPPVILVGAKEQTIFMSPAAAPGYDTAIITKHQDEPDEELRLTFDGSRNIISIQTVGAHGPNRAVASLQPSSEGGGGEIYIGSRLVGVDPPPAFTLLFDDSCRPNAPGLGAVGALNVTLEVGNK